MPCACCGPAPCCTNGYPTITFTLTGGVPGAKQCGDTQNEVGVPNGDPEIACQLWNATYVFRGEDLAVQLGGGGGTITRTIILRGECQALWYPGLPGGGYRTEPEIYLRLDFRVSCTGRDVRLTAFLGYWGQFAAYSTAFFVSSSNQPTGVFPGTQIDPVDGCVSSASYGPSGPVLYTSTIVGGATGQTPGRWVELCPGTQPTLTITVQK